ncbi:MAG: methionine ABC transporter ATP-binding protein [Erysipelotrichaceae bacterium]
MITLEHVSKTFDTAAGDVHAVKDVNLQIEAQEIYGIIGFSGAGKSTLVRCINLLERPNEGKVIVDGKDLLSLSEKELRNVRKKIGMIFQHFNLMKARTVYQNIAFPLKGSGLSKDEMDKKIMSLLDLVDLRDKKDAYPSQLSGGQKQRVAIARALANEPSVLLCDEATSALDPQTTQSILKLLKEVNEKLGLTIVLITHEMAVVKDICHKVAIMEEGRVVEQGNIVEVFSNPQHKVTQDFIDTTSSISKIYDLVEAHSDICHLEKGEVLALLKYNASNASQALISKVSREFKVNISIIFGNIEVIQNSPIGELVVIISGSETGIEEAMKQLRTQKVQVEVIQSC